jgi:pimeloyl-ACP methyl ester carboxylesterase
VNRKWEKNLSMFQDEMAEYDIPAFIDAILAKTGYDRISYVGHSQGCTVLFAALLRHPELADKVEMFFALAPVIYIAHTNSPILKSKFFFFLSFSFGSIENLLF